MMNKIKEAAKNVAYGAIGLAVAYSTAVSLDGGIESAKGFGRDVAEAVNPTPIKVKHGFFGPTKKVTINPFTGKVSDYKGPKKAANKKAFSI